MGSHSITSIRSNYPGKSDTEAARVFAEKYGYIAVIRYKNSRGASDFTDMGTCTTEAEIRGYFTSPYCHDAELIYDGRSALFPINADHVLKGHCEKCGKLSTRETLQMGSGNDFYFCPKCGLLFCDNCYTRLPLTSSPGYGMCPECNVQVKRAIPSFFIAVPEPSSGAPIQVQPPPVELPQKEQMGPKNQQYNPEKLVALLAGKAMSVRSTLKQGGLAKLDELCRDERYTPEIFLVITLLFGHSDKKLAHAVETLIHKFAPSRGRSQEAADIRRDGERDLYDLLETLVSSLQSEKEWLPKAALTVMRDFEMAEATSPIIRAALLRNDIAPSAREALQAALVIPIPAAPIPSQPKANLTAPTLSQPKSNHKRWWEFWK